MSEEAYALIARAPVPRDAYLKWKAEGEGRLVAEVAAADGALAAGTNPFRSSDAHSLRAGRVVYTAHCGSCHGDGADGRGAAMGDQYLPAMDFRQGGKKHAIFFRGGKTPRKWFDRVRDGYASATPKPDGTTNQMPPFRNTLSNEQIWLSLTFLHGVVNGNGVAK